MNNGTCRNCNSAAFKLIPGGAYLAPFFLYKVWGLTTSQDWSSRKIRWLNKLTFGFLHQLKPVARLDAAICQDCCFYSTHKEIPYQDLSNLYSDYRSNKYNQEREVFEPGYTKNIAGLLGSESEALIRVRALNEYFKDLTDKNIMDLQQIASAMDWGGADGRFLPNLSAHCEKFVYEVSSVEPVKGIKRINFLVETDTYQYMQIAHVLEHVSNPFDFLQEPLRHLADGGYLYLEVPLEVENPHLIVEDAISGKIILGVHEHINKFTKDSLTALAKAHQLDVLDIRTDEVDLVWCNSKIIRLLAQKSHRE